VLDRVRGNTELAAHQAQINTNIANEKDNEITAYVLALRLLHGCASAPQYGSDRPAATAQAESTGGGDNADPPSRPVSTAADRDFKQLIEDLEKDLASGRACQAFLDKNGWVP
jgi:hypothetical protein